jgi:hypothetical protein
MRATAPPQLWQQPQRNKGDKDPIAMTTKMRQRCQHDKGDNVCVTWALMPAQQCFAVTIVVVVIVIVVGLCLSSSPRLKRNKYWNFGGIGGKVGPNGPYIEAGLILKYTLLTVNSVING